MGNNKLVIMIKRCFLFLVSNFVFILFIAAQEDTTAIKLRGGMRLRFLKEDSINLDFYRKAILNKERHILEDLAKEITDCGKPYVYQWQLLKLITSDTILDTVYFKTLSKCIDITLNQEGAIQTVSFDEVYYPYTLFEHIKNKQNFSEFILYLLNNEILGNCKLMLNKCDYFHEDYLDIKNQENFIKYLSKYFLPYSEILKKSINETRNICLRFNYIYILRHLNKI